MLLVPRQLRRMGMTGNVPYYGGRFTPAQAYAASHPSAGWPPQPTPAMPQPVAAGGGTDASDSEKLEALRRLLDAGVLTPDEYQELRARVPD
jgi:Short C-terminal domain